MSVTLDRLVGRVDPHTIESVPSPVKPGSILTYCSCLGWHIVTHEGEHERLRRAIDAHRAVAHVIGRKPRAPRPERITVGQVVHA